MQCPLQAYNYGLNMKRLSQLTSIPLYKVLWVSIQRTETQHNATHPRQQISQSPRSLGKRKARVPLKHPFPAADYVDRHVTVNARGWRTWGFTRCDGFLNSDMGYEQSDSSHTFFCLFVMTRYLKLSNHFALVTFMVQLLIRCTIIQGTPKPNRSTSVIRSPQ